jgi:hypothetical protein
LTFCSSRTVFFFQLSKTMFFLSPICPMVQK